MDYDLNYRYIYYKYKVLYSNYIYIEENNVKYDGLFIYNNNNNICTTKKYI